MLKQFIVLPVKPKMSSGKLVSQGVHASFMALSKQENFELIDLWKEQGQCVIVCEVPSQSELFGLQQYCNDWKIPGHTYIDEGFTEIACGTATAFATGVLNEEQQEKFSQLKLWNRKR